MGTVNDPGVSVFVPLDRDVKPGVKERLDLLERDHLPHIVVPDKDITASIPGIDPLGKAPVIRTK